MNEVIVGPEAYSLTPNGNTIRNFTPNVGITVNRVAITIPPPGPIGAETAISFQIAFVQQPGQERPYPIVKDYTNTTSITVTNMIDIPPGQAIQFYVILNFSSVDPVSGTVTGY